MPHNEQDPDFSEIRFEEGLPDFDDDNIEHVDFYVDTSVDGLDMLDEPDSPVGSWTDEDCPAMGRSIDGATRQHSDTATSPHSPDPAPTDPVPADPVPAAQNSPSVRTPTTPAQATPTAWRILDLVDFHVTQFATRRDVLLDLPGVTAACAYLLESTRVMAASRHLFDLEQQAWDVDLDSACRSSHDLGEAFGPKVETILNHDSEWLLDIWYAAYVAALVD